MKWLVYRVWLFLALGLPVLTFYSCSQDTNNPTGPDGVENTIPTGITFVTIPGGTFQMGNVENARRFCNEKPVHTVTADRL